MHSAVYVADLLPRGFRFPPPGAWELLAIVSTPVLVLYPRHGLATCYLSPRAVSDGVHVLYDFVPHVYCDCPPVGAVAERHHYYVVRRDVAVGRQFIVQGGGVYCFCRYCCTFTCRARCCVCWVCLALHAGVVWALAQVASWPICPQPPRMQPPQRAQPRAAARATTWAHSLFTAS